MDKFLFILFEIYKEMQDETLILEGKRIPTQLLIHLNRFISIQLNSNLVSIDDKI